MSVSRVRSSAELPFGWDSRQHGALTRATSVLCGLTARSVWRALRAMLTQRLRSSAAVHSDGGARLVGVHTPAVYRLHSELLEFEQINSDESFGLNA